MEIEWFVRGPVGMETGQERAETLLAFIRDVDRPNLKIMVEYLQGPFSKLENRWSFEPKSEDSCDVSFFISYEFKSRMLAILMGSMFDTAFQRLASAFEKRADAIYGSRAAG